ncbi:hypothetical protein ACFLXK_03435 [Chloroflexota bacterium]
MDKPIYHQKITGRGPNIPEKVRSIIADVYLEDEKQVAEKIMYEVHRRLREADMQLRPGWPGLSAVQKELIKIRKSDAEEAKKGLEATWSLGVSAQSEHGITSESTSALLAVWNHCLAIGHVFTIREARWVARLRSTFATSGYIRTGELFAWAYEYAIRERICQVLNQRIDTIDLDAELFIKSRERYVYRSLGLVPREKVPFDKREEQLGSTFHGYLLWAKQAATNIAFNHIPKAAMRTAIDAGEPNELQTLFSITEKLSSEQDRIYAALLLFLSKGPKWDTLSTQEYLLILSALREWVSKVIPSKHPLEYELLDTDGGIKPTDILDPAFLEVVGYEVNIKTIKKEQGRIKNKVEQNRKEIEAKGLQDEKPHIPKEEYAQPWATVMNQKGELIRFEDANSKEIPKNLWPTTKEAQNERTHRKEE